MSVSEEKELKTLIIKRGQIKAKVTRCKSYFDSFTTEQNITELKLRLSRLSQSYTDFEDIQSQIEVIDETQDGSLEREEFENQYFKLYSAIQQYIENHTNNHIHSESNIENTTTPIPVRLPTISLPTFTGKYDEWTSFFDSFRALIDLNDSLSELQKLHYLKSALRNEAAEVLTNLELTSANYKVALSLLKDQFENKRLIVQQHIKSLFNLPQVQKDNTLSLRQILTSTLKHVRALESLDIDTKSWDPIIIHLVTSKLDPLTHKEWELTTKPNELPLLKDLIGYLQHKCHMLENIHSSRAQKDPSYDVSRYFDNKQNKHHYINKSKSHLAVQETKCAICNGRHMVFQCQELLQASYAEQISKLIKANLCFNCLSHGHRVNQCSSRGCKKCDSKHNTALHPFKQENEGTPTNTHKTLHTNTKYSNEPKMTGSTFANNISSNTEVLLSTALVDVISPTGFKMTCRAFIDNGSQSCFITEELVQSLGLRKQHSNMLVTGITQNSTNVTSKVSATVKSRHTKFNIQAEFLVLSKITCNLPSKKIDCSTWKLPPHVVLADPTFNIPGKIDLLLGQEYFLEILEQGQVIQPGLPIVQNTKLGWIIGGRIINTVSNETSCHLSVFERLDSQLQQFWTIEELPTRKIITREETICEQQFIDTVRRGSDGRYIVTMPLKQSSDTLGASKQTATRRLYQVEKRFRRQPEVQHEYAQFMTEYETLGHMSPVTKEMNSSQQEYFLPHHPVIKESSTSTRLRVVFDASAKSTTGVSLNDILMTGPVVQDDLFSIVLRFRMYTVVLTADIEKMYRQILINSSQRNLLSILWRENNSEPLQTYQLKTVTYGTACAPYLSTRTLNQLSSDEQLKFPEAAEVLKHDFYVDDLLTGTDSIEGALNLQKQMIEMLQTGGFNLRKWNSNVPELLKHLNPDMTERQLQPLPIDTNSTSKTLGLVWNSAKDKLAFTYKQSVSSNNQVSKRSVLSDIARLFDPLGLVAPVVVRAKMFLQELWQHSLGWDEELPRHLDSKWHDFRECLASVNKITIERCVMIPKTGGTLELHGFSDASEKAYGAVIYVKHSVGNTSQVRLLCSKSKVAPLKTVSIPRLELCAALLLVELSTHVLKALQKWTTVSCFWTDSTIVLAWLAGDAANWKIFVANRVSKIQDVTHISQWRHVRSEENPADLLSRGTTTSDLTSSQLWWCGPTWLQNDSNSWPSYPIQSSFSEDVLEKKKKEVCVNSNQVKEEVSILNKYSSIIKLQRVIAFCLRFIGNCKTAHNKIRGPITPTELLSALRVLLKHEQHRRFPLEISQLQKGDHLHQKSKLIMLQPFMDNEGLIRVGGRLDNAHVEYDQKYPIILPDKSILTKLIIRHEHFRNLHAGPQLLLCIVRQHYWPINGRNLCRQIVYKCIRCFKAKPKWSQPIMGTLPEKRTTPSRPFTNVGVDYCGPVYIRYSNAKRANLSKGYIAIYVCFATKAIHLELVTSLTTEAFLASFRRFIARRGLCQNIYSDNGTNFVGAQRELEELYRLFREQEHRQKIIDATSAQRINWHFNPPKSPHFGGLWEAGVKAVKYHLRRTTGNANFTFEEFYTILTMVEACLNSRPITHLSSDPNDPQPLTPGHFLIGQPLTLLPDPDLTKVPVNRLSHWQRLQEITQHFWKRWSKEYLNQLQQRQKWTKEGTAIQPGHVVLVRDDDLPPLKWITAIVLDIHPGSDGRTRVATIKTTAGEFKRAVNRLCILPIDS